MATTDGPTSPATACIGLGSNVGDRGARIRSALDAIAGFPNTSIAAVSALHETDPVGPVAQGLFLNAAATLRTRLAPRDLLAHLNRVELDNGRDRQSGQRWGPRTLDLDLLLYGALIIDEPGLTLPHPRMHERAFVLDPLAEIAPDLVVPTLGKTVRELRIALNATTADRR